MAPFQRCQPELELIDAVAEDLQLGLAGEPPLRGAPQSWRSFGACGDGPVRYQLRRAARDAPVSAAARSRVTQSEPSSWAVRSSSSSHSSSRSSQSMSRSSSIAGKYET